MQRNYMETSRVSISGCHRPTLLSSATALQASRYEWGNERQKIQKSRWLVGEKTRRNKMKRNEWNETRQNKTRHDKTTRTGKRRISRNSRRNRTESNPTGLQRNIRVNSFDDLTPVTLWSVDMKRCYVVMIIFQTQFRLLSWTQKTSHSRSQVARKLRWYVSLTEADILSTTTFIS